MYMDEEKFYAGFKDGALQAEYFDKNISFRTVIPITSGRNRESALFELAEKMVDKNIYDVNMAIDLPGLDYEPLSHRDQGILFESAVIAEDNQSSE